jgi:hypothetical protein
MVTALGLAVAPADAELNQFIWVEIRAPAIGTVQTYIGGNGGVFLPYNTPIIVPAGGFFLAYCYCWANHDQSLCITARGYEE